MENTVTAKTILANFNATHNVSQQLLRFYQSCQATNFLIVFIG